MNERKEIILGTYRFYCYFMVREAAGVCVREASKCFLLVTASGEGVDHTAIHPKQDNGW